MDGRGRRQGLQGAGPHGHREDLLRLPETAGSSAGSPTDMSPGGVTVYCSTAPVLLTKLG